MLKYFGEEEAKEFLKAHAITLLFPGGILAVVPEL
jgi:hypothetical protein